jgi:LDH2 family malate/lactate/ureidoglycolate dehydrogenase
MAFNPPPTSGIRVPAAEMRLLAAALFEKAGTSGEDAERMSSILVETDLRGIFSHGTKAVPGYIRAMLDGQVNPRPVIRVIQESATTRVVDGDGGMGHLACDVGTRWAIAAAKQNGLAGFTTRNHFHFGAASAYTRMALEHDFIGLAISSRRIELGQERSVIYANPGSPISVAIPADKQPPLVMDMGVWLPWDQKLFAVHPQVYFRNHALGCVLQALGAILAGIYPPGSGATHQGWVSNQGAFIVVFDVERFMHVAEFKKEMDRYIGEARRMQPLPGHDRSDLAGGPEWQREQDYARTGIPIDTEHQRCLQEIATQLGVITPFAKYADTRFTSTPRGARRHLLDRGRRIVHRAARRLFG